MRWTLCLIGALVVGCSTTEPAGPTSSLTISVAPLALPGVLDACYTLSITNDAGEPVWTRTGLCSDRYGDGAGALTYIAPCDATDTVPGDARPAVNKVTLRLENLFGDDDATNPIDVATYVNPCGSPGNDDGFGPCQLAVSCVENADAQVRFDLTVMRDASQGFFDVAVEFEDVFCSGKLDCQRDGHTIELLHDSTGARDTTVVLALACTGGPGTNTYLYMSDVVATCRDRDDGATRTFRVDPQAGVGSLGHHDDLFYDAAVFMGAEQLADLNKLYWNVALGIEDDGRPALGRLGDLVDCELAVSATASDGPLTAGATPSGTWYPYIDYRVRLNHDTAALTCTNHPLNGNGDADPSNDGVTTRYTDGAGLTFPNGLAGNFDSPEVPTLFDTGAGSGSGGPPGALGQSCLSRPCAAGLACEAGLCVIAPGGVCAGSGPCTTGHSCRAGRCVAPAGGLCAAPEECVGGLCVQGACAATTCQEELALGGARPCEVTAGVCADAVKPAALCRPDGAWSACDASTYAASSVAFQVAESACDGQDNDCDGAVDEVCAASGRVAVMGGGGVGARFRAGVGQTLAGRSVGEGELILGLCAIAVAESLP